MHCEGSMVNQRPMDTFTCRGGLLLGFLSLTIVITLGQKNTVPEVNILFVQQLKEWNDVFEIALKFIKDNHVNVKVGKTHYFDTDKSQYNDSVVVTPDFCKRYNEMLEDDEPPDIVIDFTRIGAPSEGVKAVLQATQIPTIAATYGQEGDVREWRSLTDAQQKYLIQISPPPDVLIQLVRSFVDKQGMTSAVVLFDEEQYEMYHKYKALLQNMPTRHLLTKTNTNKNVSGQIEHLVHVDVVNFFIAGKLSQVQEVITEASKNRTNIGELPYFSDEYAWYSMSLIPGDHQYPNCHKCEEAVTLVHLVPEEFPTKHPRKDYLEKARKDKRDKISLSEMFYFDIVVDAVVAMGELKKSKPEMIVNNTCKLEGTTLHKYSELKGVDLLTHFSNAAKGNVIAYNLGGKTGKNWPQFNVSITRLVYKAGQAEPDAEHFGKWVAGFGDHTHIHYKDIQRDLTVHLAYTVFRIVTYVQPPFVMKLPNCTTDLKGQKYRNCYYGYCIDLLKKIRGELKFNFTIKDVTDGYGYMNASHPNHTWNGMVRELQDRKADIALGAMSVMAERESIVDFTVPYYDLVGISILMKKPKVPTSLFKFLTVLENDVWMCILGSYFFTSFLMWVFDRWSPYSYQNNREKYEDDDEKREFNLKECLWFCMTSLTPQGGGEAPKMLSGRLVAATWWLFGFIIIASYTANLAAFLTVSRLDAPIESLEDLVKQYKVQYAPMVGSSAWIYFDRMRKIERRFYNIWKDMALNDTMEEYEQSRISVWDYPVSDKYSRMWEAMMKNNPPKNFTDAVERVRNVYNGTGAEQDGFALLEEATNVKWQTTISCDFDQKGEEFSRKPYAIAVQKGSPLKESISHMILKLLNQRYLEQLKETWWNADPPKVICPKDEGQSDGISIHNIGGVFIVIFVGIVMACFTLVFEYWWYKKRDVSDELAEMALPTPKEFGSSFTATPPKVEKTNFNTQYDKPPERTTLPSIENSW